jgi:hypothetical protein
VFEAVAVEEVEVVAAVVELEDQQMACEAHHLS